MDRERLIASPLMTSVRQRGTSISTLISTEVCDTLNNDINKTI
ncbi:hypothetical protein [Ruminococcus sp.]|nr:hypothetical protein [Ruminococcus sp.]